MSQFWQGVTAGSLPPEVPLSFVTDSGTATPAAHILNVLGGTGATTSGSGNTVTVTVINDGFSWVDEAATFTAAPQTGYFCTGTLTVNLPVTAGLLQGATVIVYVDSASVVTIQAAAGQTIQVGSSSSSVAGTAVSTAEGSVLELVYRIADSEWHTISIEGIWTTA